MKILPRIRCADGFSMSVQASDFHCCTPKTLDGPYSHVEVGYPSEPQEKLLPYRIAEEDIDLEHSIFGHVPVAVLVEIINDHGGLSL
jgi:hypothetical protein